MEAHASSEPPPALPPPPAVCFWGTFCAEPPAIAVMGEPAAGCLLAYFLLPPLGMSSVRVGGQSLAGTPLTSIPREWHTVGTQQAHSRHT